MSKQENKKILLLNRGEAVNLANNLMEYAKVKDSSARFMFDHFWIQINSSNLAEIKPVTEALPISDHNSGFEEE